MGSIIAYCGINYCLEVNGLSKNITKPVSEPEFQVKKNVGGAMHFIYYINRLTATKVDSTYLGCLTSNTQRICLWQGSNE